MEQPSSSLQTPQPPRLRGRAVAVAWALSGGLFAIFGAFIKESTSGPVLLVMLVAPAIEEILKPSGVYYLLERRPQYLSSRWHVAFLSMVAGFVFATIENLMYLYVYVPDHPPGFAIYRWTVCVALHMLCSLVMGLGLGKLLPRMRRGEPFELEDCFGWVIAAIAIHAVYNTVVTAASYAGWQPAG